MGLLIGISGKRGSGKDLLGAILSSQEGFTRFKFASVLKRHCQQFFGLTEEQTDGALKEAVDPRWKKTPRQIMIEVGTFYRVFDENFWVDKILSQAVDCERACITDVRYRNEAERIRAVGGVIVRLERDPLLNIYKDTPVIDDKSETDLDSYEPDFLITEDRNRTAADLEKFAKGVLRFHKR